MKKTYINPNISVYEIKVNHQLLSNSLPSGGDTDQNLSRSLDFDDEEDW